MHLQILAGVWDQFQKMWRAVDGPTQAHRDVLVAVFWNWSHTPATQARERAPDRTGTNDL